MLLRGTSSFVHDYLASESAAYGRTMPSPGRPSVGAQRPSQLSRCPSPMRLGSATHRRADEALGRTRRTTDATRTLRAALVTLRPRQWLKNPLVIAAAGAAGALGHDDVPVRVALAFVAFCMLASGIYAINDVRDRDEDRLHPRKRYRPVAAGELDPRRRRRARRRADGRRPGCCARSSRRCSRWSAPAYLALTLSYTLDLAPHHLCSTSSRSPAASCCARSPVASRRRSALSRWFVLVVTCSRCSWPPASGIAELRRAERSTRPPAAGGCSSYYNAARLRRDPGRQRAVPRCSPTAVWAFELPRRRRSRGGR